VYKAMRGMERKKGRCQDGLFMAQIA